MRSNLWSANTPARFWRCELDIAPEIWTRAAQQAKPVLGLSADWEDIDTMLALVLGERQFGPDHWRLKATRRLYYRLKPVIPRPVVKILRQMLSGNAQQTSLLRWPIEPRFAEFQWELMRQVLLLLGRETVPFVNFWPEKKRFSFVLTHDVETADGQDFVRTVADWVEEAGFCSMFNFVPERYAIDHDLVDELRARGFEVGIHGLRHDGRLFSSYQVFKERAARINAYIDQLNATGFRSPSTLRHPEWMQELAIEYDLSFFDTDPYEPIGGGTMSVWPFMLGQFVELPYTLAQDFTLTTVLEQTTPQLWLEKTDFIERYHGMVLVNVHPDYLSDGMTQRVFKSFLEAMKQRDDYWHALPRDVARWWKERSEAEPGSALSKANQAQIRLDDTGITLAILGARPHETRPLPAGLGRSSVT